MEFSKCVELLSALFNGKSVGNSDYGYFYMSRDIESFTIYNTRLDLNGESEECEITLEAFINLADSFQVK